MASEPKRDRVDEFWEQHTTAEVGLWVFRGLICLPLVLVLVRVAREGLCVLFPFMARAFWGGGSYLVAFILVTGSLIFLELLILHRVGASDAFAMGGWKLEDHRATAALVGTLAVIIDGTAFYLGNARLGWSQTGFSFMAVLAAAVYLGVLTMTAYLGAYIRQCAINQRRERKE